MAIREHIPQHTGSGTFSRIALPKGRLPFPVLLYLVVVMLPIGFTLGSSYMTGVRLLMLVMIVPLTGNLIAGKYGRVLPTDILFFLHFTWIIVALAVNNPDQVLQNAGATGIEFIGGYVLARAFIRNRETFAALIRALAVIICIFFPLVLFEAVTGNAILLNLLRKLPGVTSLADIDIGKRMGLSRTQVVFVHPIHWGLFCAIVMPMCFIGLKGVYGDTRRILISCIAGVSGLMALSSGALLAIILQLGLFAWAWMFRKTHKRWLILLCLFAFCYVIIDLLSNRSPIMVFLSYATFSPATAYWRTLIFEYGMNNVWAHPLFGLGLNDWARPGWMYSGSMDNFWLVMAVRYGIPGFLTIAAGCIIATWNIGRRKFDTDPILWQFRRAWMFSFIGLSFTISTVHIWTTIYSFVFFMFGTGIWMLTASPKDGMENPKPEGAENRERIGTARRAPDAVGPVAVGVRDLEDRPSPTYTRFPVRKRP